MRFPIAVLPALLLAACASAPPARFRVEAMDTEEKGVPCVVLADDQVLLDEKTSEPIRTPADVAIAFRQGGKSAEAVKLGVRAVQVDADGKAKVREAEDAPYVDDWRMVYPKDPKRQVFFLRKNKSFQP